MPAEMVLDEAGDEEVGVVIARLPPQGQRDAGRGAGRLQQLGLQLVRQEAIGQALVTRDRKAVYRVDDGIPVLLAEEAIATAQVDGFPSA